MIAQKITGQPERRKPPCTLLHTADQARKVVLRNRWSGIVLGYRRVSAQNCPSFPCYASRSRSRAHWFECAGSYVNIRRIGYTVHSDRFRCAFLRTIGIWSIRVDALSIWRFLWHENDDTSEDAADWINCSRWNLVYVDIIVACAFAYKSRLKRILIKIFTRRVRKNASIL